MFDSNYYNNLKFGSDESKPKILEYQYADAFNNILKNGIRKSNRTGVDTIAIQHQYFQVVDILNHFPIIRGKKVFPKMALKELIWMLLGRNDVKWLNEHGVTYWNEWTLPNGTIGKSYGYQYRNFNGYDQLKELVELMKNDPLGRRHIINLWNSSDLKDMALPPCMYDFHFSCVPTGKSNLFGQEYNVELHAKVRSNDSFLGAPYDFMFCGWFIILICEYLNITTDNKYIPFKIHYTADDYHLYVNHENQVNEYLKNVQENKHNCIEIPTKVFIDKDYFYQTGNKYDLHIDYFLNIIEQNLNNKNFIQIAQQFDETYSFLSKSDLEYGKIQADVAI